MFNLFNVFQTKVPDGVEFIGVADAKTLMDDGKVAAVIDVRGLDEWVMGRIPGAYHAPVGQLAAHMNELSKHRNGTLVVYCRTQNRSGFAAGQLATAGFTDVKVINGGILQWVNEGMPLEK
jgi:rhodanese-related sulfurtransferase